MVTGKRQRLSVQQKISEVRDAALQLAAVASKHGHSSVAGGPLLWTRSCHGLLPHTAHLAASSNSRCMPSRSSVSRESTIVRLRLSQWPPVQLQQGAGRVGKLGR